jgi:hypothetical protein
MSILLLVDHVDGVGPVRDLVVRIEDVGEHRTSWGCMFGEWHVDVHGVDVHVVGLVVFVVNGVNVHGETFEMWGELKVQDLKMLVSDGTNGGTSDGGTYQACDEGFFRALGGEEFIREIREL